ncbi:MAG: ABC transporter permease subunit, partial [Candidatus Caldatribacteriaceae bacterium]
MRGIWTVKTLLKRDFFYTLYNFGYYGVLFASFLVSSFFLKNFLDASREEDILVSAFPLNYPLYLTLIIISLY